METKYISLSISVNAAIDKLSKATGNYSFRIISPLSGNIKDDKFRVTLSPGFNYPCQPILTGKITQRNNGCNITCSFLPPYLGIISLVTIWGVFLSLFLSDSNKIIISSGVLVIIGGFCLLLRRADKNKLMIRLLDALNNKNI